MKMIIVDNGDCSCLNCRAYERAVVLASECGCRIRRVHFGVARAQIEIEDEGR